MASAIGAGLSAAGGSRDCLITGIPRSGTSYLCNLLHRFDDCVAINEPVEFFTSLLHEREPKGIATFYRETRRRVIAGEPIVNKLVAGVVTSDTAHRYEIAEYVPTPRTARFVLAAKNTASVLARLDDVTAAVPHALVVACIRNPYDVIGSWIASFRHMRDVDFAGWPVLDPGGPWLADTDRAALAEIAAARKAHVRRALLWRYFADVLLRNRDVLRLIRYPDLTERPAETIEAAFAGLRLGTLSIPLEPSSPRRRKRISRRDRKEIHAICTDAAEALGVPGDE